MTPSANLLQKAKTEEEAWETYRLYQRDLLLACFEDADLMLRRMKDVGPDDRRLVVSLLWDKRCQPWKFFLEEHLARPRGNGNGRR